MRRWLAAFCLYGIMTGTIAADGLVYRLPKDGTAALYTMKLTMERRGQKKMADGMMRIAVVGTEKAKGKKCRWLEVRLEIKEAGRKAEILVFKALIPEAKITSGENPLTAAIKGYSGDPRRIKEIKDFSDEAVGPFGIFLCEKLADQKQLKKSIIVTKLGKFECQGIEGKSYFKPSDDNEAFHATFTNRMHPKAPFGVLKSDMFIRVVDTKSGEVESVIHMNIVLSAIKTGVKSELPESK